MGLGKESEIDIIDNFEEILSKKVNFISLDGCWNCKNSGEWDREGGGVCKPLTEILRNFLKVNDVSNYQIMDFVVDNENKCDWWEDKDESN
jgi:hypothetical protein